MRLVPTQLLGDVGLISLSFPTSYSFQDFSPLFFLFFFGPKPSNLLSKASKAVVGHDPVQWVVAENWGEIQTGLVNRRSLKPAIKSFFFVCVF